MTDCTDIEKKLAPALEALGLFCFGWFVMADDPFAGRRAVLVGNHAQEGKHAMWEAFRKSAEYSDTKPDAMDRWTQRVVGAVAKVQGATAIYPFGNTLWPFQRYAKSATGMQSSPLGLLIHPEFGLWQAYRSVLIFNDSLGLSIPQALNHPCDTCFEKPCLSACPVEAFSVDDFAVEQCRTHLASGDQPACMSLGCRARAACPVGIPYVDEQIRFHMRSFAKL